MSGSKNLEVANLICRFGDDVLLDRLEEVVLPAFLEESLERGYGGTRYFFYDVQLLDLGRFQGESYKGVAGRIVKETSLTREQVYDRSSGLVKSRKALRTAPSSIFVLILNQHRLLYSKEMVDSPGIAAFRATLLRFLRIKHKDFVDSLFLEVVARERAERVPRDKRIRKPAFVRAHPEPTLQIIPLSSDDNISSFIDRFDLIRSVEIVFSDRNDELNDDAFYSTIQKKQAEMGDVRLKFSDSGGLPRQKVKKEVSAATASGNQIVKLNGVDKGGDKLSGNNEDFKVKKALDSMLGPIASAATAMFDGFKELVSDNVIKNPKTPVDKKEKLKKISVRREVDR